VCFSFLWVLQAKSRADERTRTAYTCSLGVCGQWLLGVAGVCKSPISRRLPLLRVAASCTVLRSRWYHSGIRMGDSYRLTAVQWHAPATSGATIRRHRFLGVAVRCTIGLSRPILLLAVARHFYVLRAGWCQKWCQRPTEFTTRRAPRVIHRASAIEIGPQETLQQVTSPGPAYQEDPDRGRRSDDYSIQQLDRTQIEYPRQGWHERDRQ
jgi:hypothetical protein